MINIYKQIRAFYSLVFEGKHEFRPTHISLYMFLLNQNNRSNWVEWFKCPFDTVMLGACINSNKTYYNVLNDLQDYKLIKYQKGINNYKAPKIHIVNLTDEKDFNIPVPEQNSGVIFTKVNTLLTTQVSKQLSKQQCAQLDTQLSAQLSKHKDILLTNNFRLVIIKEDEETFTAATDILKIINELEKEKIDSMIELTLFKGDLNDLKQKFAVEFSNRYGFKTKNEIVATFQSWMSKDKSYGQDKGFNAKSKKSKIPNSDLSTEWE